MIEVHLGYHKIQGVDGPRILNY